MTILTPQTNLYTVKQKSLTLKQHVIFNLVNIQGYVPSVTLTIWTLLVATDSIEMIL